MKSSTGSSKTNTTTIRSLGTWIFDKRSRKRKYISLTGKVFTGQDAIRQSRADQYSESHPAQQCRMELCLSNAMAPVEQYLQVFRESQQQLHNQGINAIDTSMISGLNINTLHLLSSWALPEPVLRRYRSAKITELFPWQIECLLSENGQVLSGARNLVYTAPTSGGKTLVAELLMLRKLSTTLSLGDPKFTPRRTIFFVVPFLALADEKLSYFQYMWQDMNIGVKGFHHQDEASNTHELGEDVELVVCTIERANILFTYLLDQHREQQLSMIVIDEIHLLSDKQRGFLLEVLLSKVKYVLGDQVQIIGMSATLPNIQELAHWLQATLYMTNFRPVELKTLVCDNRTLYEAVITHNTTNRRKNISTDSTNNNTNNSNGNTEKSVDENDATRNTSGMDISLDDADIIAMMMDVSEPAPQIATATTTTTTTTTTNNNNNNHGNNLGNTNTASNDSPSSAEVNFSLREVRPIPPLTRDDDGLLRLCFETLQEDKSALLFCNSKHRCEVVAKKIADALRHHHHHLLQQQKQTQTLLQTQKQQMHSHTAVNNIAPTFHPPAPPRAPPPLHPNTTNNTSSSYSNVIIPGILTSSAIPPINTHNNHSNSNHQNHHHNHPQQQPPQQASSLFHNTQTYLHQQRQGLLDSLRQLSVGLCPLLQETIPFGIAYHHAGLTQEERVLLEQAFRSQTVVKLLVTTSTLSAGVNLPAHRVILRGLKMADQYLSVATFRQMCGRAGRTGLDTQGEAIIMLEHNTNNINTNNSINNTVHTSNTSIHNKHSSDINALYTSTTSTTTSDSNRSNNSNSGSLYVSAKLREERLQLHRLCTQPLDPLQSSLAQGYGGGLEKLLLEMIVCRRITDETALLPFVQSTLFAAQNDWTETVLPLLRQALLFLKREQLITAVHTTSTTTTTTTNTNTISAPPPHSDTNTTTHSSNNNNDINNNINNNNINDINNNLSTTTTTTTATASTSSAVVLDTHALYATPLGKATTVSGLSPHDATFILPLLQHAKHRLWLPANHALHILYLITPIQNILEPQWRDYEHLLTMLYQLSPDCESVAEYLQISRAQAQSFRFSARPVAATTTNTTNVAAAESTYHRYKRFYNAILLFLLLEEWPMQKILQFYDQNSSNSNSHSAAGAGHQYNGNSNSSSSNNHSNSNNSNNNSLGRGKIQQLQRDTAVFATMLVVFCQQLNWPLLATAIQDIHQKLGFGSPQPALMPLLRLGIDVMSPARAKWLVQQHQIASPEQLLSSSVSVERLAEWLTAALPYQERDVLDLVHPKNAHHDNNANNNSNNNNSNNNNSNNNNSNNNNSNNNNSNNNSNNNNAIHERARSQVHLRALRLAQTILARAEAYVQEDMRRVMQQQQQHHML